MRPPEEAGATLVPAADGAASLDALPVIQLGPVLGEGAVGVVHSARQPVLDRSVAVKKLKVGASARARERLLHEARMMGSLEHPNIIPVHALGADAEGTPLLVMKRVDGWTWRLLLDAPEHAGWDAWRGNPDPLERNVEILVEVVRTLGFANGNGIVHRDVKPENVMLGPHGEVYVLDWGLAVGVGAPTTTAGTPHYMAPEMMGPGSADAAMDAYGVGAVLHRLLTGEPRNAGATLAEAFQSALEGAPATDPRTIDAELGGLANALCASDPARRPSLGEALVALRTWLRARPATRLLDRARERIAAMEAEAAHSTEAVLAVRSMLASVAPELPTEVGALQHRVGILAVREALERGAVEQAAAELAALTDAPADLRDRVHAAVAAREAVEQRAVEMDVDTGLMGRTAVFATIAAASLGAVAGLVSGALDLRSVRGALVLLLAFDAVALAAVVVFRKQVFVNRASTALIAGVGVVAGFDTLGRATAWLQGSRSPRCIGPSCSSWRWRLRCARCCSTDASAPPPCSPSPATSRRASRRMHGCPRSSGWSPRCRPSSSPGHSCARPRRPCQSIARDDRMRRASSRRSSPTIATSSSIWVRVKALDSCDAERRSTSMRWSSLSATRSFDCRAR
ncbi:MAG: serine/threonine protein kinase [Alphaproteobacteria bacterium]|nr:serine/threonine protein kinase [Alphaproteobacteria bacterium]